MNIRLKNLLVGKLMTIVIIAVLFIMYYLIKFSGLYILEIVKTYSFAVILFIFTTVLFTITNLMYWFIMCEDDNASNIYILYIEISLLFVCTLVSFMIVSIISLEVSDMYGCVYELAKYDPLCSIK